MSVYKFMDFNYAFKVGLAKGEYSTSLLAGIKSIL